MILAFSFVIAISLLFLIGCAVTYESRLNDCLKKPTLNQKNECYLGVVLESKNAALCDNAPDSRDDCIRYLAQSLKESTYCNYINDNSTKNRCYSALAIVTNDTAPCRAITADNNYDKEYCFTSVAELKKDVSICEEITNDWYKSNCYMYIAAKTGDLSICNRFEGINKTICLNTPTK